MSTTKTIFDGKTIHVPPEMLDAEPGEVTITYTPKPRTGHSIWDVIGKNPHPLTDEQMRERLREIREDRDAWDQD